MQDQQSADPGAGGRRTPGTADKIKVFAGVVAAAFVLALIYGPAEHYIPIAYLNILLAAGLGYAVGMAGRFFLRKTRIHNRTVSIATGVIGGVAAVAFGWGSYLWVVTGYDFEVVTDLITNPFRIVDVMRYIAENPLWSLSRRGKSVASTPSIFYYGVWLAEFVIVVYFAVKVCLRFFDTSRLCDACGGWVVPSGEVARFAIPDGADGGAFINGLHAAAAAGDAEALGRFAPYRCDGAAMPRVEVHRQDCADCGASGSFVNGTLIAMQQVKKKKKPEKVETALWRFTPVTGAMDEALFGALENAAGDAAGPA